MVGLLEVSHALFYKGVLLIICAVQESRFEIAYFRLLLVPLSFVLLIHFFPICSSALIHI
jgi:hypothetical protein